MTHQKKYFTMFACIFYGHPGKSVVHSKRVADAVDAAQARYLVSVLNKGLLAKAEGRQA